MASLTHGTATVSPTTPEVTRIAGGDATLRLLFASEQTVYLGFEVADDRAMLAMPKRPRASTGLVARSLPQVNDDTAFFLVADARNQQSMLPSLPKGSDLTVTAAAGDPLVLGMHGEFASERDAVNTVAAIQRELNQLGTPEQVAQLAKVTLTQDGRRVDGSVSVSKATLALVAAASRSPE
jgi:hypothetical protein